MTDTDQTAIAIEQTLAPGQTESQALASLLVSPQGRHAFLNRVLTRKLFNQQPDPVDTMTHLKELGTDTEAGGTSYATQVLVAQAATLDALFTDLMHRAVESAGAYPQAFERYTAMAMKAQSNCRTTLEALTKLHAPREQVVRHVHVYEGGQAVVADEFHHHAKGVENAGSTERAQTATSGAALLGADPFGGGMPITEGPGKEPVPHARRRQRQRRTAGQS